jgi:hypothetical protein
MATNRLQSSPEELARKSGQPAKRPGSVRASSRVKSKSSPPPKPKFASSGPGPSKTIEAGSSKQSSVLAMLRKPGGTTISAIMRITGWQQHSVRGFFAGTVRKRLGLNLTSNKSNGERSYRIKGGKLLTKA